MREMLSSENNVRKDQTQIQIPILTAYLEIFGQNGRMEGRGVGKRGKEIEDEKEKWGGEDELATSSIFVCVHFYRRYLG